MDRGRSWVVGMVLVGCTPDASPIEDGDAGGESTTGSGGSGATTEGSSDDAPVATSAGSEDDGTAGTTAPATGDETSGVPFEHELYTLLTADGHLALHSNLPPDVAGCEGLAASDPPCDDLDADGLVDAWEDAVIDRLRPLRRMDEAESAIDDATAVMADVGRVYLAADGSYRLMVMLGYSRDYGSCGFTAHNGDSERVVLALAPLPREGAGGVVMERAYTAAHEGTVSDHGRVFEGADLDLLVFSPDPSTAQPRWTVYPSADKHATYATIEICEGISPLPCFDEDCAPDGVGDPAAYDLLPAAGNAGEPEMPRLTALDELGFPGDDAWADQDFCGGLGGSGCSSSVRSKLLDDPF